MFNFGLLQTASPAAGGGWTTTAIWFVLMIAVFYFVLIRPQQKRTKQRKTLLSSLKKNDKVVTIGGIFGTIVEITDEKVTLRVNESTKLTFDRNAISSVASED